MQVCSSSLQLWIVAANPKYIGNALDAIFSQDVLKDLIPLVRVFAKYSSISRNPILYLLFNSFYSRYPSNSICLFISFTSS